LSFVPSRKSLSRQQLFLALRERIEQGKLVPGELLPSERALGQEFGVDRSAIRHALQQLEDSGLVVREPGRRPWVRHSKDGSASAPRFNRVETTLRTILAIIPQHPIYPASLALLHGINATLRSKEAPYRLQVFDTHGNSKLEEAALENQALDSIIEERIAGIVLWHMGDDEAVLKLRTLQDHGVPVVLVDRYPSKLACDYVGVDNRAGIEDAISYLRSLGHTKIAHLTTDESTTAVLERLKTYKESIMEIGGAPRPEWIFTLSQDDPRDVRPAVDHFFGLADRPTAVCAMNDSLAHYFIAEVEARGMNVPIDISVIGFDDLERYSPRPALLTTLHQPFDKIGRRAADLLLDRLGSADAAQEPRRHILLPTPLVERSTCRPLK